MALAIWYAHPVITDAASFEFVFFVSWQIWVVIYATIGLVAWLAKRHKNENVGRGASVAAVIVSAVWATNFLWSFATDYEVVSPIGAIVFAYLAIKDFIILGIPFSPTWDQMLDHPADAKK